MMLDIWQQLQSFMGRGGPVLWVILALLVLMWILMIERLLYLNLGFGPLQQQLLGRWQARSERLDRVRVGQVHHSRQMLNPRRRR